MTRNKKVLKLLTIINIVILILNAAWMWQHKSGSASLEPPNAKNYPLLAKRLFVESPSDSIINFSPLRRSLKDYFKKLGTGHSFYFEYLPTGTSIKIGDEKRFVGASLIKTPLVMNLYKAAELKKLSLDQKVTIKSEWLSDEFGTLYKKGAGAKIELREAARLTLKDSDNTAANAVVASSNYILNPDNQSLNAIDVDYNFDAERHVLISAKSSSSVIKCLYFSCFLTKEHSQELLGYLTESSFKNLIVAGLPKDIKVAHKIGTFDDSVQSDCGIVYLPKRNYVICIMLAGDRPAARQVMPEISKRVYRFLISKPPAQ